MKGTAAPLAGPWLLLAALEVALQLAIPDTGLRGGGIPLGARMGFAALAVLTLAAAVALVGAVVQGLERVKRLSQAPVAHQAISVGQAIVLGGAVLLYVSSWGTFWSTGAFLDGDALAFLLVQPIQLFHWVYPPLLVGVALASFALACLVVWISGAVAKHARVHHDLMRIAGGVASVLLVAVATSALRYGWSDFTRATTPYAVQRAGHAGPIVHAVRDTYRRALGAPVAERAGASDTLPGANRRIVSMEEYLAGADARQRRPYNVVLVQVESLRSDQLRAYGGTRDVMPALDALARESRVFTNAYVQASHSNYADLVPLSSHYPLRSARMYEYPANPPYPRVLIYEVLKAIGYRTGIFSSQNEGWGGMLNFHRPAALDTFFHAQTFGGPTYTPWEDAGFADWVKQTKGAGSVDDRYTVSEAMQWLDTLGRQPFFLQVNLQSSHLPYVVPPDFPRRFGPTTLDFAILWGRFPLDRVSVVKDRYADSLFYADTQVGRLFDHLRSRGLLDNTVVVVGGDNGEAFYEHGFSAHASWLFNEVVKVPMIVRAPGLTPGKDDRPAMFLDVPPSVFDLLGLPSHPSFQGISLFTPNPDPNRSLFMIAQTPAAYETAIVRGRYKLHFAEMEQSYFLNDLVSDPGETSDVGARLPDVVGDLRTRLHRWREAQLAYYADLGRQRREYPPVVVD